MKSLLKVKDVHSLRKMRNNLSLSKHLILIDSLCKLPPKDLSFIIDLIIDDLTFYTLNFYSCRELINEMDKSVSSTFFNNTPEIFKFKIIKITNFTEMNSIIKHIDFLSFYKKLKGNSIVLFFHYVNSSDLDGSQITSLTDYFNLQKIQIVNIS